MLPEITNLEISNVTSTSPAASTSIHKTFDWDFDAGDFKLKDGKLVEVTGLMYVQIWVRKALLSRKQSLIYVGTEYGSEHTSLIGSNLHPIFLQSEYERLIREALLGNDAITEVSNFNFSQSGSRLLITFEVQSIYGTTAEEVMA